LLLRGPSFPDLDVCHTHITFVFIHSDAPRMRTKYKMILFSFYIHYIYSSGH
jgi:hypothetical protein